MGTSDISGVDGVLLQFPSKTQKIVSFDRAELSQLLGLYGRHVAEGEWRDYAIDFSQELATFSVFRRSSEQPLYRVVKNPSLLRKQGLYAVVAQGGLILKRGNELEKVLRVLTKKIKLANA